MGRSEERGRGIQIRNAKMISHRFILRSAYFAVVAATKAGSLLRRMDYTDEHR